MPKVSVIVPVYNVEEYLKKCIDSIINQSLSDIEIILIDDGSTDNSGKICDEYANEDKRIKVVHKANEGLSCARNDGIDLSTAPYIMFVDADDWVEEDFCRLPYVAAIESKADLILFTYKRVYTDGRTVEVELDLNEGVLTEADAIKFNFNVVLAVWVGLYHRELFNNCRFPIGKYHEDTGTSHRLIHEAKKTYLLKKCLYNYRVDRQGSIMNSTMRNHPDLEEMLVQKAQDLSKWGYSEYAKQLALRILIRYGCQKEDNKCLFTILNAQASNTSNVLNWKMRVMSFVLKLSPLMFDTICNVTGRRKK